MTCFVDQTASPFSSPDLEAILLSWSSWAKRVQLAILLQCAGAALAAAAVPRARSSRALRAAAALPPLVLAAALPLLLFDHVDEIATLGAVRDQSDWWLWVGASKREVAGKGGGRFASAR